MTNVNDVASEQRRRTSGRGHCRGTCMDVESFLLLCRHDFSPPKIPGCAPLGSALGFFKRSLIEAKRAPKRRVPRDDFHSFENTGYASLGSAPGFAGRLFDRRRARWYRCVPYEMGRMKRAGRKDAGLLQSRPMSPSKAVVKRNVAKATLQKPWKTDPSC